METPIVRQLDYAASDESGQFTEALVIRDNGVENYILHRTIAERRGMLHQKMDFPTEEELVKAFPSIYLEDGWVDTNDQCGYKIDPREFEAARQKRLSHTQSNPARGLTRFLSGIN